MKKKLDEMTLLLGRNNINLSESVRKRDNHDRDIQLERRHALMASTLKPRAFLIDSGASNHMMASKESFSSLDFDKSIPIHMGDDSQIISKGKGTVKLEHGSLFYVMYVPSLASNMLSVYKMTHTGFPKRVSFSPNGVEISDIASRKVIATSLANHHAKTYEFSKFLSDAKPTALLTHGNEVSRIWNEIFGNLNLKYLQHI